MPKYQRKRKNDTCPKISIGSGTERVSLKDSFEASPLVLIFYPGDFSSSAITLLKRFAAEFEKYHASGYQLLAVGHGNPSTLGSFVKKYNLPFPCLHDSKKAAAKAFGVVKKVGNNLLIQPHVFVINQKGVICFSKGGYPKRTDILKSCR